MQHKKQLGQNFIVDKNIIKKLVSNIKPKKEDIFIEIGPGDGAMTLPVFKKVSKMYLIEKDIRLIKNLQMMLKPNNKRIILNEDVLKYNFNKFDFDFRLIGNLPYNISTEILFKICKVENIIDIHFMLQKEVVDRIISQNDSKEYGRLSVMTQAYFFVQKICDISRHVFQPKPKVTSSFIRLLPRQNVFVNHRHENNFKNIVRSAFMNRRKMIKTSLKQYFSENEMLAMSINPKFRPENLSVKNYLEMSIHV